MRFRKLSNASAVDILRFHRSLLADTVRTETYRKAIEATVRANNVVADIGCGSGILSFFAARAGAKRVYAIEEGPVIELARTLAKENGLADRIVFINALSLDATIDEKVDVIVTETMGNTGLDEHIVRAVDDARRRWLREDGVIIPQSIDMIVAPVDLHFDDPSFWSATRYEIDFSRAREYATNMFHPLDISEASFVAAPAIAAHVDLRHANDGAVHATARVQSMRGATITGIGVWFRAQLTNALALSNQPPNACPSWKQSFLPIGSAIHVARGDEIAIDVQTFDGMEWKWSIATSNERAEQSTMSAFPLLTPR